MRALPHHVAFIHHDDLFRVHDGGDALGNDQQCTAMTMIDGPLAQGFAQG